MLREHYTRLYDEEDAGRSVCVHDHLGYADREIKEKGAKVAVIGLGSFYPLGEQAAALIKEKTGVQPTLINPYYITGVDTDLLESLKADHDVVITLEDGVLDGGFGEKIAGVYGDADVSVLNFGL